MTDERHSIWLDAPSWFCRPNSTDWQMKLSFVREFSDLQDQDLRVRLSVAGRHHYEAALSQRVEGSGSSRKRQRKRNLLGSIATRFGSSPRCVAGRDLQDNRDNRDGLVEVVLASPRGPAEPVTPSPYCPRLPTKKNVTKSFVGPKRLNL